MRSGRVRSAVSERGEFAELAREKQIFLHRGGKKDRRRKGKIDHSWSKRRLGDVLVSVGGSSYSRGCSLFLLESITSRIGNAKPVFPFSSSRTGQEVAAGVKSGRVRKGDRSGKLAKTAASARATRITRRREPEG